VPQRVVRLAVHTPELEARFRAARAELGIAEEFPADVLAAADELVRTPSLPGEDLRHLELVTLDPPGSLDLDQAFHLARRRGGGFRVHYAIADVGAWVRPGSPVDLEAHGRVLTAYSPDRRNPLHPPVLSEAAASLLPDGPRPAAVWRLDVGAEGELEGVDVRRAMVASRAKLDYRGVQAAIESGAADPMLALLAEVGPLLQEAEVRRGGVSLNAPSQEIVSGPDGYRLVFDAPLPVEGWNAQLSLLTGRAAARLMIDAGVGVLRTMPPADDRSIGRLRGVARSLGIEWSREEPYGHLLRRLDGRAVPGHAAFLEEAAVLFRGASYVAFAGEPPEVSEHAAIAAPYAHCTAPLRRLVDRYATEVCLALAAGDPVPEWVLAALPVLPQEMAAGSRRAGQLERTNLDLVEAAVLEPHVGEEFEAVVVDLWKGGRGEIMLADPAVAAPCDGPLELGEVLRVRLLSVDAESGTVEFGPVR
jgi:exoribonuclease R